MPPWLTFGPHSSLWVNNLSSKKASASSDGTVKIWDNTEDDGWVCKSSVSVTDDITDPE